MAERKQVSSTEWNSLSTEEKLDKLKQGYSPQRQTPHQYSPNYSAYYDRPQDNRQYGSPLRNQYYSGRYSDNPHQYPGPQDHYRYGQPQGEPYGGQPYGGQPYGGHPYGGHPYGGYPQGGHPYGHSSYAYELDKQNERNVESVKDDRREKVQRQQEKENELDQAKRERESRVNELEGNLQNQKIQAEGAQTSQNKAVADYNYSPYRGVQNPYSPYWSSQSQDKHRDQLDEIGKTRQTRTEQVSKFYDSKFEAEKEAAELDKRVASLEQELGHAKEARRRNSVQLQQAVTKQETDPWRSNYGTYADKTLIASNKADDIKKRIEMEAKLKSSKEKEDVE